MAAPATRPPSERFRQAVEMSRRGDLAGAESACAELLARTPDDVEVNHFCGVLANRMGRFDVAADRLARCVRGDPGRARAQAALGFACERAGRLEAAREAYAAAARLEPGFPEAHIGLGAVCIRLGAPEEALACFGRALAIDPALADARVNAAHALVALGRSTEAKTTLAQVLQIQPDFAEARLDLAQLHVASGDTAAAREALEGHGAPALPAARALLATILLASGELERGWREYGFRPTRGTEIFETIAQGAYPPSLPRDLHGVRIALLGEQGLGDMLFFLRFARPLAEAGAKLAIKADRRLEPLVRRALPVDAWIAHDGTPSDMPAIWMGDLPRVAMERTGGGAHETLRIAALDDRVAAMRSRLAPLPRPWRAVAWRAGTAAHEARAGQSVLAKEIAPATLGGAIKGLGGSWLSIQRQAKAGEADELASHAGAPLHDFSFANEDLEDMLALLATIDEYAGVSSTNVHLAAAAGARARILVPHPPEWRWQERGPSPFFPEYPVYRQTRGGDWSAALERLRADLEKT